MINFSALIINLANYLAHFKHICFFLRIFFSNYLIILIILLFCELKSVLGYLNDFSDWSYTKYLFILFLFKNIFEKSNLKITKIYLWRIRTHNSPCILFVIFVIVVQSLWKLLYFRCSFLFFLFNFKCENY
jgi:hypothetical protein